MEKQELEQLIRLLMVPKVGSVLAKNLIAYCGSAAEVFRQKKAALLRIPGIGQKLSDNISGFSDAERVAREMAFIEKHHIKVHYFLDEGYPRRLKDIPDAPVLLFFRGNLDLNAPRILGIVGTRKATDYGKGITEKIVEAIAPYKPVIISGLAYGIDHMAHKAALKYDLPTLGVMGNGLDTIYPAAHRNLAVSMTANGGIITEYPSGVGPSREHFPARNRIVAGMLDGLLVVETAEKGGALITAEIANSYNREVFAIPGRVGDTASEGCNYLIKTNRAYLVENASDLTYLLGWDMHEIKPPRQQLYHDLTSVEKELVELLRTKEKMDMDSLSHATEMNLTALSILLLELEFKGIVQALPGKHFRLL